MSGSLLRRALGVYLPIDMFAHGADGARVGVHWLGLKALELPDGAHDCCTTCMACACPWLCGITCWNLDFRRGDKLAPKPGFSYFFHTRK